MTDKEKIKDWAEKKLSEVESEIAKMAGISERLYPELIARRVVLKDLLFLIRSMQEEPIDYDKLNAMLDESLSKETKESWNEMLGKEEPKKCMFTKDNYTDEDRKVLCDGCEEECKYSKSDDFTKALAECIHQARGSVADPMVLAETWKDELIKLAKSEEPVSEDFEAAANNALERMLDKYGLVGTGSCLEMFKLGAEWQKTKDKSCSKDLGEYINELSKQFPEVSFAKLSRIAVRVAKWQKEQMMKDATEAIVKVDAGGYPYIPQIELYDYDKDVPLAKEGEKYKVVLIKEV